MKPIDVVFAARVEAMRLSHFRATNSIGSPQLA
jgi:hypothetical protein